LSAGTALLAAAILLAGCGRTPQQGRQQQDDQQQPATEQTATTSTTDTSLPKTTITLYFPSATDDRLVAETREIVDTARPTDRGTQVLVELLAGPKSKDALPAVPEGTTLRQLWIAKSGIAWADFSDDLETGLEGGSSDELLAVYSIVDSLTANVPQIKRVGVLVGGKERETLAGHVDIRRPLPAESKLAPPPPSPKTE
jgi:spore germination protein GerM